MLLSTAQRFLGIRELREVDVDGPDRIEAHTRILESRPLIREVFDEFHRLCLELDERDFNTQSGMRVELGAGVWPIRNSYPDVLATDIVAAPGLDRVLDAQDMDLPDSSVRGLYGQNCFHHFPDPAKFFTEAERVLMPGGGVILIEPYYGPAGKFLYRRMFASEVFDPEMPGWTNESALGPMEGANQALSYIVFVRDRAQFEQRFPDLEIVRLEPLSNYLRYLLSGGLNFRQFAPSSQAEALRKVESALKPVQSKLALHHVIVLRKKTAQASP